MPHEFCTISLSWPFTCKENTLNVRKSNWKDFKSMHVWVIETMIGPVSTTKECVYVCLRSSSPMDWSIPNGVSGAHPSPIRLIMEMVKRSRKGKIIFRGTLTPTASSGLISILLAQPLQECYCVSVSGASSWWAAMPAWKARQFHIWSGNRLPLTKLLIPHPLVCDTHQNQTQESAGSQSLISCQVAMLSGLINQNKPHWPFQTMWWDCGAYRDNNTLIKRWEKPNVAMSSYSKTLIMSIIEDKVKCSYCQEGPKERKMWRKCEEKEICLRIILHWDFRICTFAYNMLYCCVECSSSVLSFWFIIFFIRYIFFIYII